MGLMQLKVNKISLAFDVAKIDLSIHKYDFAPNRKNMISFKTIKILYLLKAVQVYQERNSSKFQCVSLLGIFPLPSKTKIGPINDDLRPQKNSNCSSHTPQATVYHRAKILLLLIKNSRPLILSFSLWQFIVKFASQITTNAVQKGDQATKD